MKKVWSLGVLIVGMLAMALLLSVSVASASHSWGKYHWARTATNNPFTLKVETDLTGAWPGPGYLTVASNDWSLSSKLDTAIVDNVATASCDPILHQDRVCNAEYGLTGWLGIAQIWIYVGGGKPVHIAQGRVKLNDTYFNNPPYNTDAWRQFVICQEVGHTLGLDHQDTTFDNPNLGTCMDYTSDPDGTVKNQLSNLHPNQHDYDQLVTIYGSHTDSFNSYATQFAGMPAPRSGAHNAEDFGTPTEKKDGKGRVILFVKPVDKGQQQYTWVIWAD